MKTIDVEGETIDINESFQMNSDSVFELVAEGEDIYGYTHRSGIFTACETAYTGFVHAEETIMDKNGNVLFVQD